MISIHPSSPNLATHHYARGFVKTEVSSISAAAELALRHVWSPIAWIGGKRLKTQFETAAMIALDFDNGELSLADACNIFCDLQHFIGTTKSHQIPKHGIVCDRFRVVIALDAPTASCRDYEYTIKKFVKKYSCDPAAADGARYFFPCRDLITCADDGYTETVEIAPPEEPMKLADDAKRAQLRRLGRLPHWIERFVFDGKLCQAGGRNHTLYAAAKELAAMGYARDEGRRILLAAKIDWKDLTPYEIDHALRPLNHKEVTP